MRATAFLSFYYVTSLAEVWIEIRICSIGRITFLSLPLRKCGLKLHDVDVTDGDANVTSLAEVWIEIKMVDDKTTFEKGHFPCGSVD